MAKFCACVLPLVASMALAERLARTNSHQQSYLAADEMGGPDKEFDKFFESSAIQNKKCGCGDTKCLDHYKSALIETKQTAASSVLLQERSKTAKSVITLHWAGKNVLDMRECFLKRWTAMPVTPSNEFKIVGTLYDIMKDLGKRGDLTTSSTKSYINKPLNLCITRPMDKASDAFAAAFGGNWAGIGGVSTLITFAGALFAGESAALAHQVASNPSSFNLDAAVDAIIDQSKSSKLKKWWSRVTGNKMIAWLSLGSCGRAPLTIKFKVKKIGARYSATWSNGRALTAKHIAALIAAASR